MFMAFNVKSLGISYQNVGFSLDTAVIGIDHPLRLYKAISICGSLGMAWCVSDWFLIPRDIYYKLPYNLDNTRVRITLADAAAIKPCWVDVTVTFYKEDGYGSLTPKGAFTKGFKCAGNLFGTFDLDFVLKKMSAYEVSEYRGQLPKTETTSFIDEVLMQYDQELIKAWDTKLSKAT